MTVREVIYALMDLPLDAVCLTDQDGASFAEVGEVGMIKDCYVGKWAPKNSVVIGDQ
jgi:hypothetical protein